MVVISTVLLSAKGDVKKANLTLEDDKKLTTDILHKYLKKKSEPEKLGYYQDDDKYIFMFGYSEGKKGTENKHELPPPYNDKVYYGDIILIATNTTKWQDIVQYKPEQWNTFCASGISQDNRGSDDEGEDESEEDGLSAEEEPDEEELQNDNEFDETAEDFVNEDDCEDDDIEDKNIDDDENDGDEEDDNENDDDDDDGDGEGDEEIDMNGNTNENDDENNEICNKNNKINKKLNKNTKEKTKKSTNTVSKINTTMYQNNVDRNSTIESNEYRKRFIKTFDFSKKLHGFSDNDIISLELNVFKTTWDSAQKYYIPRNWKSPQFKDLYLQISRQVFWNLHPDSPVNNKRLVKRIKEGEFTLDAVPTLTHYEMFPEHWRELADRQIIREQKILEGNRSMATDMYECKRCHKRECTYYEMQTRSADEPATIFITCLNCGKNWRK
jgi:DNA-directed RNA polymerase subunit M/transcription elongation factor TFIIS